MPYDSQGNFTRVMNWTSDYQNGIEIVCDRHDDEDNNFALGLNMALCRDGRAVMSGNLKMGSNKITGLANGETANDAVNMSQIAGFVSEEDLEDYVSIAGDETITGDKTFTGDVTVPTPTVSDNTQKPATTAYINTKFQVVASLPATPDADTFYFIPEE
jgi:hypothetical protein